MWVSLLKSLLCVAVCWRDSQAETVEGLCFSSLSCTRVLGLIRMVQMGLELTPQPPTPAAQVPLIPMASRQGEAFHTDSGLGMTRNSVQA